MQDNQIFNKSYHSTFETKDVSCLSLYIDNEVFEYAFLKAGSKEVATIVSVSLASLSAHKSNADKVKQLIFHHKLNSYEKVNVFISLGNSTYTIVPSAFSVQGNEASLLNFSNGKNTEIVRSEKFKEMQFIYGPDPELISLLEKEFKNAVIRHSGSTAIELFFSNPSLKNADIWINIEAASFELLAGKGKKLLFYNRFEFSGNEDILYYLLFMMEQYQLDSEKIRLYLSGTIEVGDALHSLLKKYIRHISFAVNAVRFTDAEWKLPEHAYFTLLNQHLCGS